MPYPVPEPMHNAHVQLGARKKQNTQQRTNVQPGAAGGATATVAGMELFVEFNLHSAGVDSG